MGTDDSAEKLSNAYSTYLKIDNQKEVGWPMFITYNINVLVPNF